MKKKIIEIALVAVLVLSLLIGCGGNKGVGTETDGGNAPAASGDTKKVTALFFSLEGEYFTILDTLLKNGLTELGYEYESQSSNMDPVTMIEQIENAVAGGTDALWIWALNGDAIKDACVAAREKGVIVYNFVTDPGEDARDMFRGSDNEACGRAIGEMAIEWADDTYGADAEAGSINAILMGDPSSSQNKTTFEALQAKIAEDPRFNVLEAVGIETSTVKGQETAMNMFSKYGTDINCFITCGGEMALGVCSYLTSESSPVSDPTTVGVFGTEINEQTAAYMKDGVLKGSVSNGGVISENIATQVKQLDCLLQGKPVEGVDDHMFSQVDMGKVTLENIADYGF